MQDCTNFFAEDIHRDNILKGQILDQKTIIKRYKDSLQTIIGHFGDRRAGNTGGVNLPDKNFMKMVKGSRPTARQTRKLSSKKIIESLTARGSLLCDGDYFLQRSFASENSQSVVNFFFENLPTDNDNVSLLLESADFLCRNTNALGKSFSYHLFARHELIAHLMGLVFGANFIFSDKPQKSIFVERLFHPTYVCCIGATILHHLEVTPEDPSRRLKHLVCDHMLRYWTNKDRLRKITRYYFGEESADKIKEMKKLIRKCLSGPEGISFVMDCWHTTSLLHDSGYYLSLLWDTIGQNLARLDNGGISGSGIGTFAGFSRSDCFRCNATSGGDFDIPDSFENLKNLCELFDFIPEAHFRHVKMSMFKRPGEESSLEQRRLYFKNNRQYHPVWGAWELLERARYYHNAKNFPETFMLLNAAAAVYSHHYYLKGENDDNATDIAREELKNPIMFKQAPIAYLLKLVDSSQNFSRFRFKSDKKKTQRPLPIAIILSKDRLSVKLNISPKYKSYLGQKALTISFCGKMNDPSRTKPLKNWVEKNNEDQQKHYNPSKGAFFVNIRNAKT